MIVKNEEHALPWALKSVRGAADEIIVLDTGSDDRTSKVARRFQKVRVFKHSIKQVESFAELRNLAFSKATSKYVMWLDAGDQVGSALQLKAEVAKEMTDVIAMYTIYDGRVFLRERIAPRASARFVDRVHETMDIEGLTCRAIDVPIHHRKTNVHRESSLTRNVRLLRQMIKENPEDHPRRPRWEYYLGCDLLSMGQESEAVKHFRTRSGMSGSLEERAQAAVQVAKILLSQKNYMGTIDAALGAIKVCSVWRDPYFVVGECHFQLGAYKEAVDWFKRCLTIERPKVLLPVPDDLYTWLPFLKLAECHKAMGQHSEARLWATRGASEVDAYKAPDVIERFRRLSAG